MTKVLGNVLERVSERRRKARGVSVQALAAEITALQERLARVEQPAASVTKDNSTVATSQQERNAELIALLDSFDKQAEKGDPEQQQREFAEFQQGIDAARPGQRSIFGEGFNP